MKHELQYNSMLVHEWFLLCVAQKATLNSVYHVPCPWEENGSPARHFSGSNGLLLSLLADFGGAPYPSATSRDTSRWTLLCASLER
mmetsp:Transcript_18325/g.24608  ORF Transcript_18325/g.24608 Transcript_18325/m.24608 type:complete len:86 (+) Transcript_18325:59-316(+)